MLAHVKFLPFSELGSSSGQMEYFTHEGFAFEKYVWASWFRVNGLIILSFLFSEKFNWFLIVKFYFKLIYYEYGIFIEEAHHEETTPESWYFEKNKWALSPIFNARKLWAMSPINK